jgi:cytochrome c5
MRFRLEALLACGICLTGSACRPASGQAVDQAQASPPGPSGALTEVIGQKEKAALAALPEGSGRALVEGNCLICHGAALIQQQHKDTTGWAKTVKLMRSWGAPLKDQDEPALIDYLSRNFGNAER